LAGGIEVAITDLRRKGRPPIITVEDKSWVIHLACKKPKDLGYSYERWTISLLAQHIKKNALQEGHPSLVKAGKSLIHGILKEMPIYPHKMRSYLTRRDPEFEQKNGTSTDGL